MNSVKSISHQGVKVGGKGGPVTRIMKNAISHQVWPHFMHLDTIKDKVHNIEHVDL